MNGNYAVSYIKSMGMLSCGEKESHTLVVSNSLHVTNIGNSSCKISIIENQWTFGSTKEKKSNILLDNKFSEVNTFWKQ